MRQRYLQLLVMLVVSMGTVLVASGILHQEVPAVPLDTALEQPAHPATGHVKAVSQAYSRFAGMHPAPPSHEQDPHRDPLTEERAPVEEPPPGGVEGIEVAASASGEFLVRKGSEPAPAGRATHSVRIEVEEGLPISVEEFSEFVMASLNDERSWAKDGAFAFSRTDGEASIRIMLASPSTTDGLCVPLETNGKWSCGRNGRVVINADRWINNAPAFAEAGGDIVSYRHYLLNHEIGHLIGFDHVSCTTPGQAAPVMVQQSMSLEGCTPNGWVHP